MRPLVALAARLHALVRGLGVPRAWRWIVLAATLLAATSVGPHRVLDDHVLGLIAHGRGAEVGLAARDSLDLFTFTRGDPAGNHRLMDEGLMLPWWTDPELRISFFRPVSSVTHWVDERLFPGRAVPMHLHSLAWFAAMVAAAGAVYRRLSASGALAGLATLLYAVDDAHGPALSWLANRNALIATVFGCACLVLHDAWRRGGSRVAAGLAVLAFVLGLLSGELAVGALAYLVAYAACLEEGRPARRVASTLPYLAVLVAWRVGWARGGFGARGSGAYVDPLGQPAEFLLATPAKLLVMLHGQFSAPPSDVFFLAPPHHRPLILAVAVLTATVVVYLLAPLVRKDAEARFWALGTGLALAPLGATFPSDRLLPFVGIGAMALLARLFESWLRATAAGEATSAPRSLLTAGLLVLHVVAAPALLPGRSAQMELFGVAHDRGVAVIPVDPSVSRLTVVVVAAPTVLFANYLQAERALAGVPRPAHVYVLSSASSAVEVTRTGPDALTLRPERGFLYSGLERHYRGTRPLVPGDRVQLSAMTATVRSALPDGRPQAVEFTFDPRANEYLFLKWEDDRFVPFDPPEPGARVTLPEEDFGAIILRTALRGR